MKKLFSHLLILSFLTFLVMSATTYNVNAQVKKNVKKISSTTSSQSLLKNNVKPPLPVVAGPRSVINCYPSTGDLNTGSVDGTGTVTQTSLVDCIGGTEVGWMKFDLSAIPSGVTVTGVVLNFYVNTTDWPYFDINQLTSDPLITPGSDIWTEVNADSRVYLSYTGAAIPLGWNAFTLNSNANTDVQSQIGAWWAVGCLETDGIPTYYWTADGWGDANVPYITVTYSVGPVVDAETSALWMPTHVPQITFSPFSAQNIPWTAIVKNDGSAAATFNVNSEIFKGGVLDATFVNTATGLPVGASQTFTGNYTPTSSANYNFFNQTTLAGDTNPLNDTLTYPYTCITDTVFAWDDGVYFNAIGFNGPPCWLGTTFTLSAQDTLTSASIFWGQFAGTCTGNAVELWNTSSGVPTTLNTTIASGITLTSADNFLMKTYEAAVPIVLPAGTYCIIGHQTITLAGTYLLSYDNGPTGTPWTSVNVPRNISFYSADGISFTDVVTSFPEVGMARANFGAVPLPGPAIVTTTAPSAITQTTATSGGNVVNEGTSPVTVRGVCWNTTGNPTTADSYTTDGSGLGVFASSITGLSPNTIYHVRAYATNLLGPAYGADIQFQTPCGAVSVFPYNYDFASPLDPCWSIAQVSGTGNWTMATSQTYPSLPPESGTYLAYFNSFNFSSGTVSRLNTPPFDFTSLPAPIVQFYMTQDVGYAANNDQVQVEASVDGGANWTTLGTFLRYNAAFTTPGWDLKTVDLSAYGGLSNVLISFKATSYYGNDLSIDNVTVKLPVPNDVGTFSVDVLDVNPLGTVAPKATVKNFGSATQTFNVNMTITGGYNSTKTVTSLAPGTSVQVTFDNWTPASPGSYLVHVCTQLAGDANTGNDCMDKSVWAYNGSWTSGSVAPAGTDLASGVGYTETIDKSTTGYLFSIGGEPLNTGCYKYNVNTDTWTTIASLPLGRNRHTTAIVDHYVYCIGGSDPSNVYQSTVYRYDINNDPGGWVAVASLPAAQGWGKAVGYNNHIYLCGGYDGTTVLPNVYVYDVALDTWSTGTAMPFGRFGGACSITGNTLVYIGGIAPDLVTITNTVFRGTIDGGNPLLITWTSAAKPYPGNGIKYLNISRDKSESVSLANNTQNSNVKKTKGNSSSPMSVYPSGTFFRFDAAPWGTDGIIVAAGCNSTLWTPPTPDPCWVYKPGSDTWMKQGDVPIPVAAPALGSVMLGGGVWKLIVASGYTGATQTTATQIWTDNLSSPLNLGLTAMLSGYCNGTTMNYTKSVTVELHASTTPYGLIESKVVTLDANGLGNPIYTTAVNGTPYYIVIKTDNGLETWSATAQTFTGSTLTYDFTSAAGQAYGNNQQLVGTKWCIISGDANQDGAVDALDRSACWNDRNLTGVYATDLDGNGTVDALDRSIAWNNRNLAVAKPALVSTPTPNGKQVKQDNKGTNGNTKGSYDLRLDGKNAKKVVKKTNN